MKAVTVPEPNDRIQTPPPIGVSGDEPPEPPPPPPEPPPDALGGRIERWKRDFLDLTTGNPLLDLRRSRATIDLLCPDPPEMEDLLAQGDEVRVVPAGAGMDRDERRRFVQHTWTEEGAVVADVESEEALQSQMDNMHRRARTQFDEGGVDTLFLAIGMLLWESPSGEGPHRAPLILLPASVPGQAVISAPHVARRDDDPFFNITLVEKLRRDFGVDLREFAHGLPEDDSGVDVRGVWETVRRKTAGVGGLETTEGMALSRFNFAKQLMWRDLDRHPEMVQGSAFARRLADPEAPYSSPGGFIKEDEVDRMIQPADLLAPFKADASQVAAVHASAGPGDFVLVGPPGTGKSETIANIIAHNLGLGRSVLFVSEKKAALEVVHRRLKDRGLGPLCLEMHSAGARGRSRSQSAAAQLDAAWRERDRRQAALPPAAPPEAEDEWRKTAAEVQVLRDGLNDVARALEDPGPSGESLHRILGRALRNRAPGVSLADGWGTELDGNGHAPQTAADYEALVDAARSLGEASAALRALAPRPEDADALAGVTKTDTSVLWCRRVAGEAAALAAAIREARRCADGFLGAFAPPGTVLGSAAAEARTLARLAALTPGWVAAHESALRRPAPLRYTLLMRLSVRMAAAEAGGPDRPRRRQRMGRVRRILSALRRSGPAVDAQGPYAGGILLHLAAALGAGSHTPGLGSAARDLVAAYGDFEGRLRVFRESTCQDPGDPGPDGPADASATPAAPGETRDLDSLLRTAALADSARLTAWARWREERARASEAGLEPVAAALEGGEVTDAAAAFRDAYARWIAPKLLDRREHLRAFDPVRHEAAVRRFQSQEKALAKMAVDRIWEAVVSKAPVPPYDGGGPGHLYGFDVLRLEMKKKTRRIPARRLIEEMGPAVKALTPCLMMSPLSVAQFLPAEPGLFDIVVFDEASQITVPDAVGALSRAARCIIVGDPMQLPPTNFFELTPEVIDDSGPADLESVLDAAEAAGMLTHRLTGHYRSRHESLIAFSNDTYYGGALVTYPRAAAPRERPVRFRRVDGVWGAGGTRQNEAEAKAVVEEVARRLRHPQQRELSIGIVTMNQEQQRLIEDLLFEEMKAHKGLVSLSPDRGWQGVEASAPIFVKNLETVQGDERDVILLSVGYGPATKGGAMPMRFGPLGRAGGERRLNVAITRATTEVIVFASFDPGMIDLRKTRSQGVKDLKSYIEFAQHGPAHRPAGVGSLGDYESEFEVMVAERLVERGWDVRPQVGMSKRSYRIDIGVVHPDRPGAFLAGVECDGASYHSSRVARLRDHYRQLILEDNGWRLVRVWSTDFFRAPDEAIKQVDDRLREMLAEDRGDAEAEIWRWGVDHIIGEALPVPRRPPGERRHVCPACDGDGHSDSDEGEHHVVDDEDEDRQLPPCGVCGGSGEATASHLSGGGGVRALDSRDATDDLDLVHAVCRGLRELQDGAQAAGFARGLLAGLIDGAAPTPKTWAGRDALERARDVFEGEADDVEAVLLDIESRIKDLRDAGAPRVLNYC